MKTTDSVYFHPYIHFHHYFHELYECLGSVEWHHWYRKTHFWPVFEQLEGWEGQYHSFLKHRHMYRHTRRYIDLNRIFTHIKLYALITFMYPVSCPMVVCFHLIHFLGNTIFIGVLNWTRNSFFFDDVSVLFRNSINKYLLLSSPDFIICSWFRLFMIQCTGWNNTLFRKFWNRMLCYADTIYYYTIPFSAWSIRSSSARSGWRLSSNILFTITSVFPS